MPTASSRLVAEPASTPAEAVTVRGLGKRFGEYDAIQDLSFSVIDNQFTSIVGPSGCGKSTLLRIIAGLIKASSGSVLVRGQELSGPVTDAGMVFQAPVLLPWRTALSNILFAAEMRGERAARYKDEAMSLINLAGLEGFERHYPHELSGGMQQRVAICRALLRDPMLLLMDEPFGALDIMTRERMSFELQRIWEARRHTVILVTHSIIEAVLLSDRIIVMSGRPRHATHVIDVDLPRPRRPEAMKDPRFIEIAATVREHIEARWME